jgi:hypothetical protein
VMMIDQGDDQVGRRRAPPAKLVCDCCGFSTDRQSCPAGADGPARNETSCLHHGSPRNAANELVGLRKDAKHCGEMHRDSVCHNGVQIKRVL